MAGRVWFTSDLHISHRAVAYARRYGVWPGEDKSVVTEGDVMWHNDMLAEKWDAVVDKDDVVWVLGDLIANARHLDVALDWIAARPGTKHLILGNHDPAHPMMRDAHKWQAKLYRAFDSVASSARRKINGRDVLLSHFPYNGDGVSKDDDRFTQWRLRDEGLPIIHGHTHDENIVVSKSLSGATQVHIGLDAHDFTPVSLDTVMELL